MQKTPFKATTAMVAVLSLTAPANLPAQTLLETLGSAGPDAKPLCADGAAPTCPDGTTLLSASELMVQSGAVDLMVGDAAALCSDETAAVCADGSAAILPGAEGYAEAQVAAGSQPVESEPVESEPAESADAADPEELPADEVAEVPEAELPSAEVPAAEEPEVALESDGTLETEGTMDMETEVTSDVESDAESQEGDLAAALEAEAETPAEETAEAAPEAEVTAEETAEADAATTEDTVETEATAEADPEDAPLVIPGAEALESDVQNVLDQITGSGAADDGEGAAPAAMAESDAEAENVTEVEVTEEDTRQSDEDFTTTANANIGEMAQSSASASGDDDGMSDFEKAALVGLGALAVGAILSNGDQVVTNSGDRVVVERNDGDLYVLKDDDTLLRQPGARVRTERFSDGSTRSTVTREDGSKIITVRDASGRVVHRVRENEDGTRVTLIDDIETYERVEVSTLPPIENREVQIVDEDVEAIRVALDRASARSVDRSFSLRQVREIEAVRKLVPEIALDNVNFRTGSAAVDPSEAEELTRLGRIMTTLIAANPGEIFLIEGHTDAVGNGAYNLALSDRRAESVALALTEYFDVPPENMVVQGYGESDLKVETLADERLNRRVSVRRITPLLEQRIARN